MQGSFFIVAFLAATLAICSGSHVTTSAGVGTTAISVGTDDAPKKAAVLRVPGIRTVTDAGNNVAISRSNIFVVSGQDKEMLMDTIEDMVVRYDSTSRDDAALTTQIITLLGADDDATMANKMLPLIKAALQNRANPAQVHQIVLNLAKMSPRMKASTADNQAA
ncbi:hypothetical protein PHYBOEH_007068 [Phytophthora boehmeriae]|uniref:RxLR effector protein n=1 Tax=Phytophthora boehmeriae TaxID=109152 RepID=A0A8T1W9J5_9STRA|nr:hypothetical protein PHYBOEH_007068 [Phytophthora boehmeriae]